VRWRSNHAPPDQSRVAKVSVTTAEGVPFMSQGLQMLTHVPATPGYAVGDSARDGRTIVSSRCSSTAVGSLQ
jgi:hypothetical protein